MATTSAAELDPVFLKAIRLLHSRHPDSTEQLRMLRDEAIRQQNQPIPQTTREKSKESKPLPSERRQNVIITPVTEAVPIQREPKSQAIEVTASVVTSSNTFSDAGSIETVEELASSVVETVEEMSSASLIGASAPKKAKLQISVEKVLDGEAIPVEDLAIDLGVSCSVCDHSENKMTGNKLVECHECHSHYHQKCHEPRVSDEDANDLRLVWYCTLCIKKMREATSSTTALKNRQPDAPPSNSRTFAAARPSQSFRRPAPSTETKSFAPPTTAQSFAIPGLSNAASTSKQPISGGVGGTSSATSSGASTGQKSSMQSAMKRLQMVKKKAARKILNHQQIRVPRR